MNWLKDLIAEKYPDANITMHNTEGMPLAVTVETKDAKVMVRGIPKSPDDKQLLGQTMIAIEKGLGG